MPLSRPHTSVADSELHHPVPLPDDASGRIPAARDGLSGLACIVAIGVLLAGVAYGAGYLVEYWPWTATLLLMSGAVASFGLGVWVVRVGVANPWIKKYERWRSRSEDWKQQLRDEE